MQRSIERITGDSDGVVYEFAVFRVKGTASHAPSAYLQAALHAGELPGTVAIHALVPMLRRAEAEGRIRGDITIVPQANPIGRAQYLFGELQGRFHLGSRANFNREFPLLERPDPALIPTDDALSSGDRRLKARLLKLSLGHDLVLDLHCDDEGVPYFYVPAELWPGMADCAAAFGAEAVLTWQDANDGTFEEAAIRPYLSGSSVESLARRVVTTVELRGIRDVDRRHAEADAEGLYRLLVARGVIEDRGVPAAAGFAGVVAPLDNVEMVKAPKAGAVLYDVEPGQRVKAGDRLATIVHAPGEPDGALDVLAPQPGYVLTRRSTRVLRAGDGLLKLIGEGPSTVARKAGSLEA
jgi:predicted deacylase